MRPLRLLPWLVVLGVFVAAILAYPSLPSEVPAKLNLAGEVARRVPESLASWFLIPVLALVLQILLVMWRNSLPRHPEMFNFPDKEDFLRLPDAYRGPVVVQMQWMMDAIALLIQALLAAIYVLVWMRSRGHSSSSQVIVPIIMSVMTTPLIFLLLARVTNAVDEQKKQWRAAGSPPRATD
ncbi:MAG: DUF1648 domain-containing protein [Gemmatimonadaceae bacterium]